MDNPAPDDRRRAPTWLFLAIAAFVAVVTGVLYFSHTVWGVVGLWVFVAVAAIAGGWFRRTWREPEWVEQSSRQLIVREPKMWSAMGRVIFAIGVLLCIIEPIVIISWAVAGNYSIALFNLVLGGSVAIGFVLVGRFMMRNKRPPFPTQRQPPQT
jgi:hypothetical protein